MKKTLSLLLSLVMLLSITSGLSFNAFAESYIDEIELYNMILPVAGEYPCYLATQYDFSGSYSSDLTEYKTDNAPYKEGIAWFDITDNSYINPADTSYKFKCGHRYQVFVLVQIKDTQGGQVMFKDSKEMWAQVKFDSGAPEHKKITGEDTVVLPNPKAAPGEENFSAAVSTEYTVPGPHNFGKGENAEYEVSWNADNSSCTCTGTCKTCGAKVTETVKPVKTEKKAPACEEDGEALYTATFIEGFDTETVTEPIEALNHDFGKGKDAEYDVEWDENNICTCTGKCKRCGKTITETVKPSEDVVKEPTCTKDGIMLYTAEFTKGFDKETFSGPIEAYGHTFVNGVCADCGFKQYTLTFKLKKIKKSAKKTVIKITLKKNGKALKKKKVTLKIAGKKFTVKTNKKGVATFRIKKAALKKLKVGKKAKLVANYGKKIKVTKKVKVVK